MSIEVVEIANQINWAISASAGWADLKSRYRQQAKQHVFQAMKKQ